MTQPEDCLTTLDTLLKRSQDQRAQKEHEL